MNIQEKTEFKNELNSTHAKLIGLSDEEANNNPLWKSENLLSKKNYDDLIRWGIEQLIEKYNLNQTEAEKEMSWHIIERGLSNYEL